MHQAPQQLSALELEEGLADILASPADSGSLTSIFVRPAPNERRELSTAVLTPEQGIDGDRWVHDSFYSKGGVSDPRCQVSLMNSRYLQLIAGDHDSLCLAG